jgi:hypothetical protein
VVNIQAVKTRLTDKLILLRVKKLGENKKRNSMTIQQKCEQTQDERWQPCLNAFEMISSTLSSARRLFSI